MPALPSSPAVARSGFHDSLSLDGRWAFRFEDEAESRAITVPMAWQAAFADLRDRAGTARYVRSLVIPADWSGRRLFLTFGAVSERARVFVDGRVVGHHDGGYLPFEVELSPDLIGREIELAVEATVPTGDDIAFPDGAFAEVPHGKQSWYGVIGGIWQSVAIEARPAIHLSSLGVTTAIDGSVDIAATLSGDCAGVSLRACVYAGDGAPVACETFGPDGGRLRVAAPQLWSPDAPTLYRVVVELMRGDVVTDRLEKTTGFRSFETRDGRFYLNGEPFYLRAALDQDYYPGTIVTPPSLGFLEDQARKAKALGLNCLRCHIKVPDPRYHDVADRLGLVVWAEIPNVETFSTASAARLRDTMAGILARDGHHPSIVAWTIINEDWGTRLAEDADQRRWLAGTVDWLKELDPNRLIVDNSACVPNFHVKTDIADYHYYRTVPERREEWERLTDEFAAGADWIYSPFGDAVRTGHEPLVVSEFGIWGLPHPNDLRAGDGGEPWWFESGIGWADGTVLPHGIEARFEHYRLGRVFGSLDAFVEAAQWYQFANLKYEIESLRARSAIAGYVITELTDVHWEANGLMDMERHPRVFADRLAEVNADVVIIARPDRWACWAGETIVVPVALATGGARIPAGCRLVWRMDGTTVAGVSAPLAEVGTMTVADLAPVAITLPAGDRAIMRTLAFELTGPDGKPIAVNRLELAVHPRRAAAEISVSSDDAALSERLVALGYRLKADADVFVTRRLDADVIERIRLGARVLLLAERAEGGMLRSDAPAREPPMIAVVDDKPGLPGVAHSRFPGYGLVDRDGTIWRGDWVSSFSWIARTGAFADLPGGPMLDLAFERVAPRAVITGFRAWEYDARVMAGLVVGWVHKAAATIVRKPFGAGSLVATTFRLAEDLPGTDPTATVLIDALLREASRKG